MLPAGPPQAHSHRRTAIRPSRLVWRKIKVIPLVHTNCRCNEGPLLISSTHAHTHACAHSVRMPVLHKCVPLKVLQPTSSTPTRVCTAADCRSWGWSGFGSTPLNRSASSFAICASFRALSAASDRPAWMVRCCIYVCGVCACVWGGEGARACVCRGLDVRTVIKVQGKCLHSYTNTQTHTHIYAHAPAIICCRRTSSSYWLRSRRSSIRYAAAQPPRCPAHTHPLALLVVAQSKLAVFVVCGGGWGEPSTWFLWRLWRGRGGCTEAAAGPNCVYTHSSAMAESAD
jgi:hypothetical protein